MSTVDIIILTVIGLSFVFGAWRGLIKEILSLLVWIGALIVAAMYADKGAVYMASLTENVAFQKIISFVLIFILVSLLGGFFTAFIAKLTSAAGLKLMDRVLGALFGIFRGVIIVSLVVMLTEPFEAVNQYFSNSQTMPYVMLVVEKLMGLAEMLPFDVPMMDNDSTSAY